METAELAILERIGKNSGIIGGPECGQGYVDTKLGRVYMAWALMDGKWHGIWGACGVAQQYQAGDHVKDLKEAKQEMVDAASWFLQMLKHRGMLVEGEFHA